MDSLSGKIAIVTGASSGIGKAAAARLAERGATVLMICRSPERGQRALSEIRGQTGNQAVELRLADLASLRQVRELGEHLSAELDRLDILINNAGVYRNRLELTEDGLERTMAVNHLAHFLLTHLLIDRLRAASGRVVNVSSGSHRSGKLDRATLQSIIRGEGRYRGLRAYSDSKLANVLFTFELARRFESVITANAFHPGVLATRIWNQNHNALSLMLRLFKPLMGSPEAGGDAAVRLATDPQLTHVTGKYFDKEKESRAVDMAYDQELAQRLWQVSAELTGLDG